MPQIFGPIRPHQAQWMSNQLLELKNKYNIPERLKLRLEFDFLTGFYC